MYSCVYFLFFFLIQRLSGAQVTISFIRYFPSKCWVIIKFVTFSSISIWASNCRRSFFLKSCIVDGLLIKDVLVKWCTSTFIRDPDLKFRGERGEFVDSLVKTFDDDERKTSRNGVITAIYSLRSWSDMRGVCLSLFLDNWMYDFTRDNLPNTSQYRLIYRFLLSLSIDFLVFQR